MNDEINLPLGEEDVTNTVANDETTEITKFVSSAPVTTNSYVSEPIPYQVSACPPDGDLNDFLARPVLINTIVWVPEAGSFRGKFDPWTAWMTNTSVQEKFKNYHYMRGSLKLKFLVNGTPFHMGRLILAYEPAFGHSAHDPTGLFYEGAISTLTHTLVDPSTNAEGRMVCPFMTPFTWIDTASTTSQWIGVVHYAQLAPLTIASGILATNLEIQVYASLENAEVAYPTAEPLPVYVGQSSKKKPKTKKKQAQASDSQDEYTENPNAGLISGPANTVAKIASRLTDIPVIGPWMRATQIGFKSIAGIAGIWGYSRPRDLANPTRVYQTGAPVMAATDVADSSLPLSVGAKSELTIDPKVTGSPIDGDNMAVASIARRWSFVSAQDWEPTDVIDHVIYQGLIEPGVGRQTSGTIRQDTAMGFAGIPFRFWRGAIEVKIQIVASRFHRGRLRFSYSPEGSGVSSTETNLNYSKIFDIDQTTEFQFTIPYARNRGYLYNASASGTYNPAQHNGSFYIVVSNPIFNPSGVAKNVQVLIWVRAGPDMEFAGPTDALLSHWAPHQYNPDAALLGVQNEAANEADRKARQQREKTDVLTPLLKGQSSASAPQTRDDVGITPNVVTEVMWPHTTHPEINAVFVGDPVRSFRPLLKRYSLVTRFHLGDAEDGNPNIADGFVCDVQVGIPYYPPMAGHTSDLAGTFNYDGIGTYDFSAARGTLMTWLQYAFVGKKGSVRWTITNPFAAQANATNQNKPSNISVWRHYGNSGVGEPEKNIPFFSQNFDQLNGNLSATNTRQLSVESNRDSLSGSQVFPGDTNCVSYEIPPYNSARFFKGDATHNASGSILNADPDGTMIVNYTIRNFSGAVFGITGYSLDAYAAAGEDFSYVGWRGVPSTHSVSTLPFVNELIQSVDNI